MKNIITVGGMIFNGKNEFLLVHPTFHSPDEYKIPKGEMEEGENEETTALREIFEETGFKCKISERIPKEIPYRTKKGLKIFKAFIMVIINRPGIGDWENDKEIWVNLNNYKDYLIQREIPMARTGLDLWFKINAQNLK